MNKKVYLFFCHLHPNWYLPFLKYNFLAINPRKLVGGSGRESVHIFLKGPARRSDFNARIQALVILDLKILNLCLIILIV